MTADTIDLDFLPLKVMHVSPRGKRSFDPDGKRRLVEACLQPGASISGLALKAGVNANQLRKWVEMYRKASVVAGPPRTIGAEPSAFVPVVTIRDAVLKPVEPTESLPARRESPPAPMSVPPQAHLSVRLPNGVVIDLECSAQDTPLVKAMIAALGAR
ncbi:IS66-like element accessory protein TnpA [Burkholderia ubonensis]|uniref:IS66-like element accessory protein TnpA n=1 Tax=Burkholderia ubonensis TaxID=101571 RepID=UPI00358ED872